MHSQFEVWHAANDKICIEMYDEVWKSSQIEMKWVEIYRKSQISQKDVFYTGGSVAYW